MEILDISVTENRKRGEHRKSGFGYNKKPMPLPNPEKINFIAAMTNHSKNVGKIYREATSDKTLWQDTRFFY